MAPLATDPFTLFRRWSAHLQCYAPPATARLYRRTAFACAADIQRHPLEWTGGDLRRYFDTLKPSVAKNARQALSHWLDWQVDHGLRDRNPLADVVPLRRGRGKRIKRWLTEDELARLVLSASWGTRWHPRYAQARRRIALMILAQYYTGLRPGELCRLLVSHVHLTDAEPRVEVLATKNDDEREVPLSTKAQAVFAELTDGRRGRVSDVGVATYWQHVHHAALRAGIAPDKCRPYAMRHTFATRLLHAGVDPRRVAELMGHSDLETIMGYSAQAYPELRAAVELLP